MAGLTVLTVFVVLVAPWPPLRIVLGLLLVLFSPGYALVAALFPERPRERETFENAVTTRVTDGIDGLERLALSIALSVVVVPLIGLALNYTALGIRLVPIISTAALFTLSLCALAYMRRQLRPEPMRLRIQFSLPLLRWGERDFPDKLLTGALILSVLGAAVSLIYVVGSGPAKQPFTEIYLLDADGGMSAYPSSMNPNETFSVQLGVRNHEGRLQNYSLQVDIEPHPHVNDSERLRTLEISLEPGESRTLPLSFTAPEDPGQYGLTFRLYLDNAVEPYRSLQMWITVAT